MSRYSQSGTRKIVVRLLFFVLTASTVQGLTVLVNNSRPSVSISSTVSGPKNNIGSFPVRFESVPNIEFPDSIPTIRNVDFWIASSLLVDADGSVRNVQVSQESAATVAEQTFYDNVRSQTIGKKSDEIRRELVELLTTQLKASKFKPRVSDGESVPTMVFVTSHFHADGNSCPQIVTEFKSTGIVIWKGSTYDGCLTALP